MDAEWDTLLERLSSHEQFFSNTLSLVPKYVRSPNPRKDKDIDSDEEEEDTPCSEELNRKFQERLQALKNKRKAPDGDDEDERKPKRARIEKNAKKGTQKTGNKLKGQPTKAGSVASTSTTTLKNVTTPTPSKAIEYASLSFDMSSGAPVPTYLQQNKKKLSNAAQLHKALEQKEKLKALKQTEEGKLIAEKAGWDVMLKKAQGERVKDDVEKLKKTVKREQAQKKKSEKEWTERIQAQKKSQQEKQQKRQTNIENRKLQKRAKKMGKKLPKQNRVGFEGKKKQFINK